MQNTALAIEQGLWCHRIHVPRLGWDVGLILGVLFCIPYVGEWWAQSGGTNVPKYSLDPPPWDGSAAGVGSGDGGSLCCMHRAPLPCVTKCFIHPMIRGRCQSACTACDRHGVKLLEQAEGRTAVFGCLRAPIPSQDKIPLMLKCRTALPCKPKVKTWAYISFVPLQSNAWLTDLICKEIVQTFPFIHPSVWAAQRF